MADKLNAMRKGLYLAHRIDILVHIQGNLSLILGKLCIICISIDSIGIGGL